MRMFQLDISVRVMLPNHTLISLFDNDLSFFTTSKRNLKKKKKKVGWHNHDSLHTEVNRDVSFVRLNITVLLTNAHIYTYSSMKIYNIT